MDMGMIILWLLLREHMPLKKVLQLAAEAHEFNAHMISKNFDGVLDHIHGILYGADRRRILKRLTCIKALEHIRDWDIGGDVLATGHMNRAGDDLTPTEYAEWVLKSG